ncbi:MAG: hypothetical protein RBS39_00185 [Phycisphaerales bacterium]|jgi:hypothetical protein|nr:hypothetical protein [Phycisphaerales bacterium]
MTTVRTIESKPAQGAPAIAVALQARAVLEQCAAFIASVDDRAYAGTSGVLKDGTIGKHVRHSVDHFAAIFAGLDGDAPIDYDHRQREVPMETDRAAALGAITTLAGRLGRVDSEKLATPVRVRVMLSGAGDEAELTSTLARELFFAAHHAIHHHAMIKAIAGEFGCACGAEFGVAPSTINAQAGPMATSPGTGGARKA